jgi:adenylate cyclase
MPLADDARLAGQSAVRSLRVTLAERAAWLLQRRPDMADTAVEVGLIDKAWMEEPGQHPVGTAAPLDVVVRFLERSVEKEPSFLASAGLNAIQLLSAGKDAATGTDETTQPVAVVFTDLEGFTRFTARHGDEAALALLEEHHRAVGPIVRSRGGRIVKRLGDGLMLVFPSAAAAVHAAVELVDTSPDPLRLRAGVHWGAAVVTRDDLIGHDVNIAARVAEAAKGGQVLVSQAAVDASAGLRGITWSRARRKAFKGVGESIVVREAKPAP